ncbi:MAG: rhodanese-like domain-containing protein [Verrucomicrobiota bacterium]
MRGWPSTTGASAATTRFSGRSCRSRFQFEQRRQFQHGQVPNAVNIPLGDLRANVPSRVADKSQVLLLHCLSGGRSGIAKHQLKRMGCTNVFNLGSLGRAKRIVSGKDVNPA